MAAKPDQIYAVFVVGNCNWQIQFVYQINWQYFR